MLMLEPASILTLESFRRLPPIVHKGNPGLFALNNYWTIDGSVAGSGAEYVNHSCEPNLYSWVVKGRILYMSRRAIHIGEELTVDYNFSRDQVTVKCKCGSAKCRETINSR